MHTRALSVFGGLLVANSGCAHHPSAATSAASACTQLAPALEPPGSIQLALAANSDSLLMGSQRGVFVVRAKWSNDSLEALRSPDGAQVRLESTMAGLDTAGTFRAAAPAAHVRPVILEGPQGDYRLWVRAIGAVPLQQLVRLRGGYRDTVVVQIQPGPTVICSDVF